MDPRLSDLSKWPLDFLWCTDDGWTMENMPSDSAVELALQRDDELLKIHAEFVPAMLSHEEFWKRYFRTVDVIERYPGWTSDQMERQIRSASHALQYALKKNSIFGNEDSSAPKAFLLRNLANAVCDAEQYTSVKELADSIYSPSGVLFRAVEKTLNGSSWLPVATTLESPPQEATLSDCSSEDAVRMLFKSGEMDAFTCGCWRALTNFSPNITHYSSSNGSHVSSSNGSPISCHGCCCQDTDLDLDLISLPPLREITTKRSGPSTVQPGSPSTASGSPSGSFQRVLNSLHGAPAGSLAVRLGELMAGIGSPEEMARLWLEVMQEVHDRWEEGIAIPYVRAEREGPDLDLCGVMQHLQVLNCAIARKRWKKARISSDIQKHLQHVECFRPEPTVRDFGTFEPTLCKTCGSYNLCEVLKLPPAGFVLAEPSRPVSSEQDGSWACFPDPAETATGQMMPQPGRMIPQPRPGCEDQNADGSSATLGQDCGDEKPGGLRLLATGARMRVPEVQDGPLMTSDYLAELQEAVISTGSLNIAHKRLFSDMQAFKAANLGCILEDFVRWYSPADWSRDAPSSRMGGGEGGGTPNECNDFEGKLQQGGEGESSRRKIGYLSARMSGSDNQWRMYWSEAKPVPALLQPPLFDECAAGATSLEYLEGITPSELFIQLFTCLVAVGCSAALQAAPSLQGSSRAQLDDSVKYILHACGRHMTQDRMRYICMVYEAVEQIISDNAPSISTSLQASSSPGTGSLYSCDGHADGSGGTMSQESRSTQSGMSPGESPGLSPRFYSPDHTSSSSRSGGSSNGSLGDPDLFREQTPSVWVYMNDGYSAIPSDGDPAKEEAREGKGSDGHPAERRSPGYACGKSQRGDTLGSKDARGPDVFARRESGCGRDGAECGFAVEHRGSVMGFLNGDSSGQYQCVGEGGEEGRAPVSFNGWAQF